MSSRNGTLSDDAKTPAITSITVEGLKSIGTRQTVEVRPLTLLAGANSSGKSSLMQGLLLLKQTLESPYDPGPLLLNGANVRFSSLDQLFFRGGTPNEAVELKIGLSTDTPSSVEVTFRRSADRKLEIHETQIKLGTEPKKTFRLEMSEEEIFNRALSLSPNHGPLAIRGKIVRERCFLLPLIELSSHFSAVDWIAGFIQDHALNHVRANISSKALPDIIHIPGLRGNPERSYPQTAIGGEFPGTFENYVASILAHWSATKDKRLNQVGQNLYRLGLTWTLEVNQKDDTSVEIRVPRLSKPSAEGTPDLVNIADVGFGVSQTLPVVVALLVAREGQLVYIEQPEIHLHPRAQVAMAQLLADAANRGVRLVIETHSSLLLLGVQSLVAEGKLAPDKVILHWFQRNEEGLTDITTRELDEEGRFGDWPADFDDVTLEAQMHYLNAAERRRAKV